jgi:hypothetical protein
MEETELIKNILYKLNKYKSRLELCTDLEKKNIYEQKVIFYIKEFVNIQEGGNIISKNEFDYLNNQTNNLLSILMALNRFNVVKYNIKSTINLDNSEYINECKKYGNIDVTQFWCVYMLQYWSAQNIKTLTDKYNKNTSKIKLEQTEIIIYEYIIKNNNIVIKYLNDSSNVDPLSIRENIDNYNILIDRANNFAKSFKKNIYLNKVIKSDPDKIKSVKEKIKILVELIDFIDPINSPKLGEPSKIGILPLSESEISCDILKLKTLYKKIKNEALVKKQSSERK